MRQIILLSFFLGSFICSSFGQEWKQFKYQTGDLLFQDIDCGELCDAIESVTPGIGDKHFSHVGLVYALGDSVYVVEAIGAGVQLTPLPSFLTRQLDTQGHPKVIVGRLKKQYQSLHNKAIAFALKQLHTPYDDEFIYNNGKYYCSELIYDAYQNANGGVPFFNLYPMTYKNPNTGKTLKAWKQYFKKIKHKIPEGKKGCNPGSIAVDGAVDIVAQFY